MPVGSPNPQTIATEKYNKKVSIISKSYKLLKEVVEQCNRKGIISSTVQG